MDCVSQFHQTLEAAFGPLDWRPIADGMIHRFRAHAGTRHNWYWLSHDGHEGCFGGLGNGGTFTAARLGHG